MAWYAAHHNDARGQSSTCTCTSVADVLTSPHLHPGECFKTYHSSRHNEDDD